MQHTKRAFRYLILLLSVTAIIVFVQIVTSRNKQAVYTAPTPLVVVKKPETGSIEKTLTLAGHIEAKTMIPVVPLVSGTITSYPVTVGQKVETGDIIAQIDSEPFDQQVAQAKAAYLAYESTFKRVEALFKSKNTTEQNYDQVKAQRDGAKAQYDLAMLQKGYATVRAKASGTVITANSAEGSTAAQGQPLAVIADLNNLVVNLKVPEKYYDIFIKSHDTIQLSVFRPDSNQTCTAKAGIIDPYIEGQSKTFNVQCILTGDVTYLRPGMYVRVTVEYDRHDNVPLLPQSVRKADGSAYILDGDKAKFIEFKPEIEDSNQFMVPTQYADSYFIVDGQNSVFDGQTVRVQK